MVLSRLRCDAVPRSLKRHRFTRGGAELFGLGKQFFHYGDEFESMVDD